MKKKGVLLLKNNSYDVIILDYHLQNTTEDKIFIKPIFGSNFFNFIKELKTIIKNKNIQNI